MRTTLRIASYTKAARVAPSLAVPDIRMWADQIKAC